VKFLIPILLLVALLATAIVLVYKLPSRGELPFTALIYDSGEGTLKFEVLGFRTFNDKTLALIDKSMSGKGRILRYMVDIETREIYYFNPDDTLAYTGRRSMLWFFKPPKVGDNIPILGGYGVTINVWDNGFEILDYRGGKAKYKAINGEIYVLESLSIEGKAITLKEIVYVKRNVDLYSITMLVLAMILWNVTWCFIGLVLLKDF